MIKTFFLILVGTILFQFSAQAEDTKLSLKEIATQETAQPQNIIVNSQQDAGVIQLTEEFDPNADRKAKWTTALKLQQVTHTGKAMIGEANQYSFTDLGQATKTTLAFGLLSSTKSFTNFNLQYGIQFDAGFSSQDTKLSTITGVVVDGRLQYFDLAARPQLVFPWKTASSVSTKVFGEYGQAQLSMASRTSIARFSKNSTFYGYGLALDFAVKKSWTAEIEYFERSSLTIDLDWSLASANTQLGVQYQW